MENQKNMEIQEKMEKVKTQEKIELLFKQGILINKELLSQEFLNPELLKINEEEDILILNSDYIYKIFKETSPEGRLIDWCEIDGYRVELEKARSGEQYQKYFNVYQKHFDYLNSGFKAFPEETKETKITGETGETKEPKETGEIIQKEIKPPFLDSVQVVNFPEITIQKFEVKDFTRLFSSRYQFLERLLHSRQEIQNLLTINRILGKKEKENISLIGLVGEISTTKSGNLMATIEDPTGEIKVLFSKNRPELFSLAKDLVSDEVIGINGTCSEKIIFAENLIWPAFPGKAEIKSDSQEEEYAIFLSDIHVGSSLFLKEEFNKFLEWINGRLGDEKQKEIARQVKYIFIAGDLVDGVGVYPSQESELEIKDLCQQYREIYRLMKKIPAEKKIIVCPGNHDAVRLAEPQPVIYAKYAPELYTLPNLISVTNPALVNIGQRENFPGFDVLMYHGYSFDYYVNKVESIRAGGGYQRSDLIMKFLLQKRHLAPSFKSTSYFPSYHEDPLLIRKIPDFFVTGHIHYSSVAKFKGVTMISCSCWQGMTSFQEKLGHRPEPARVPIINLKTRQIKILRFDQ